MTYNKLMSNSMLDTLYFPPIGTPKDLLPTPALLINYPLLEANLSKMSGYFCERTAKLRPHFKTHKCTRIAWKQIEYGAIGITCAKLSEAEVLVAAGISNVLIANQVVDPLKIARLATLAGSSTIIVAVDQLDNLLQIDEAARGAGNVIQVVIEVDVGLHRSGVQPGYPALRLAEKAASLKGVHFSGLLGYEGFTMFEIDRQLRFQNVQNAMNALAGSSALIQQAGIPVEIVSAGGTGTFDLTGSFNGITEIEAGSYVFMDSKYNRLGLDFSQSLSLSAMILSVQGDKRCIIDAGMKVLSTDNGLPDITKPDGLKLIKLNEEHGIVENNSDKAQPKAGMCVEIIPSHVCTTVNLHDRYYVLQDDQLVDIWEIDGRGKSQ